MPTTDPPRPRNAGLAAFLSFLFPGLGQGYLGARRMAILFAAPILALLVIVVAIKLGWAGQLGNELLSASFLGAALIVNAALAAWRLAAIASAGVAARPSILSRDTAHRWVSISLVVLLMASTLGMHVWAGALIGRVNATLGDVFGGEVPGASGGPGSGPVNQPAFRWDGTERITFLLLGIDSGVGRNEALTDTILVVSVDPVAGTAVMISVPRDTGFVPLPDRSVYPDGVYPNKINELSTEAGLSPRVWCPDMSPGVTTCGLRTLERSIGLYLGIPIQYYATVDLQGFVDLIDAIGGVTLCLDGTLVDPEYGGPTWPRVGIELPAGCRQYDGVHALAYTRASARAGSSCRMARARSRTTSSVLSGSRRCCSSSEVRSPGRILSSSCRGSWSPSARRSRPISPAPWPATWPASCRSSPGLRSTESSSPTRSSSICRRSPS